MEEKIKNAIEEYQCSGCVNGGDISCFKPASSGKGCGFHHAGTMILPGIGNIYLGLPKGFCRLGEFTKMTPNIYETYESPEGPLDMWNIAVWKHLNEDGHTLVRGLRPRRNEPFLNIYLEDCMDKINCLEITKAQIDAMD